MKDAGGPDRSGRGPRVRYGFSDPAPWLEALEARWRVHADQLPISPATVSALIAAQFPQWAGRPVRQVQAEGTVNAIFRIGDELAARFPLRPGDPQEVAAQFEADARSARKLSSGLSFPTPQPVALGVPGPEFPLPWAVQTWLAGSTATDLDPSNSPAFAHDLAVLIRQLRSLDTEGRSFAGSGRGGDLADHDEWVQECLDQSAGLLDVAFWREEWKRLRELPRQKPDVMNHGDLIPGNVLVTPGSFTLAGVLDVGGLGPATRPSTWSRPGTCWARSPISAAGIERCD